MLGTYPVVVPEKRPNSRQNPDLERYVRWEYGPNGSVVSLLAQATNVSRKARTKNRRRIANGLRTLARVFGSALRARRSPVTKPEV